MYCWYSTVRYLKTNFSLARNASMWLFTWGHLVPLMQTRCITMSFLLWNHKLSKTSNSVISFLISDFSDWKHKWLIWGVINKCRELSCKKRYDSPGSISSNKKDPLQNYFYKLIKESMSFSFHMLHPLLKEPTQNKSTGFSLLSTTNTAHQLWLYLVNRKHKIIYLAGRHKKARSSHEVILILPW